MFASVTVLAPGLLGGSVAKAVRSRSLAKRIRAWSRRAETRANLRDVDWCDEVLDTPETAVTGSELVVVCAPVDRIVPLIEQTAAALAPGTLVTDVGSVKSEITRHSTAALRGKAHFVGAHPMAGSDRTGHVNADADLFRGRPCFVTPIETTDSEGLDRVVAFWRALDAEVLTETPERHDEIVANISHLPHILASALCSFLAQRDLRWREFASTGLGDTTRIAAGDADLWRSILEQNREEVLRAVRNFQDELQSMHAALANNDMLAVKSFLDRGRDYRKSLRV